MSKFVTNDKALPGEYEMALNDVTAIASGGFTTSEQPIAAR